MSDIAEIEAELRAGPLECAFPGIGDEPDHADLCYPCQLRPTVARWAAEREAALVKECELLREVERTARHAWGMAAFPDQNYGLSDAIAALDAYRKGDIT